MPNDSDDLQVGEDSLAELRDLLEELQDEVSSGKRKKLFQMAEILYSLGVRTETCKIKNGDKLEYGLVIPVSQLDNFKKAIITNAI